MGLPQSSSIYPSEPQVFRLSALQSYSTWGELLAGIRKHNNLTQHKIAKASEPYLLKAGMPILKTRIYGDMERGRRSPYYRELEPLFRTYVEACGVEFSDLEITAYIHLAKERMAQKSKRIDRVDDAQWEALTETLFRINNSKRNQRIHLIKDESAPVRHITEDTESRRLKAVEQALRTDTSHLLEREGWVVKMLAYAESSPQRKLVVVQGHMGTGKSHALALLIQRIAKESHYYLIPYLFSAGSGKTPEDHLEVFLATIVADLTMTAVSDEMKQRPLEERIDQILALLKERSEQGQKVILLLDDAQVIFPTAAEWSADWMQFFEALVREPHTTTLYMMTRTWPGWEDRRFAYVEELELPELSADASVAIWRRKGFDDVPEDLLREVSRRRCGYNPQLIEMAISQCKKRSWSFAWSKGGGVSSRVQKNHNTQRLEDLLAKDTIFDPRMDIRAHTLLQHSLTSRLSHQAVQMLECLTLSPLGLPFMLLIEEFPRAEEAFNELASASAVDLSAAASQRAAIVPLVREAQWQSLLNDGRKESIEQRVTDLYAYWLSTLQDFRDDAEKAALIAEMVVRYIRQRQLLKAAELFVSFGWLCTLFGHTSRIGRVFNETIQAHRGQAENAEQEVGRLLLQCHIAVRSGQKITDSEREQIYQSITDKVIVRDVLLQPHMEIDVLHNMMLRYIRLGLFCEASQMFDDVLTRLQSGQITSEVYASYLHNKSRLLVRWSEAEKREIYLDNAQRLLLTGVDTLRECIHQWRQCLKNALPLQEHYVNFKLARALNDYAYRQRLLSNFIDAQEAIEESIRLKQACAALPSSLATSLSEYSQVLAAQGYNRQALEYSEEAISIMERAIESGNTTLCSELGMLFIECADIYLQQARLEEAKQLLERAIELIGDKRSRRSFRLKAESQIKEIQVITETTRRYQLDKRWFARYHDLASFDDLAWYAHAGRFTDEEQEEWNSLYPRRGEEEVSDRLAALIVQSRKRELARSQEEHGTPALYYPMIPLEEVQQRITALEQLQEEIEIKEPNAIVRALYIEVIDENLSLLHQCEAAALRDQNIVWKGHLTLYGKPTPQEMMIALQPFCSMLLRTQYHDQAGPLTQNMLKQFRSWGLYPEELAATPTLVPKVESAGTKQQKREKQVFPPEVIQRFFQAVFDEEYRTTEWRVAIAPARDYAYVDIDSRTVFLPPYPQTEEDVRDLLAEEIEVHAYRSMSGQRSPLALLGSGLAKYKATEEGLANLYTQQVSSHMHGKYKNKSWISTLCIGFVSGVMMPEHSFIELCDFLEQAFLINRLYRGGNETGEEMLIAARDEAWTRAARIFRGIPDLNSAGICSLRDRVYLQGYMDVLRYLERGDEQRLLVGKIKIEDLDAMAELNILTPYYPRRHLALASDLSERISQYK